MSLNTLISKTEDYKIDDWVVSGTLAPSVSQSSPVLSTTVGSSVPTGSYYLGVIVDAEDAIKEAVENNNTGYDASPLVSVELMQPDLIVRSIVISDAIGPQLSYSCSIENQGKIQASGTIHNHIFLSLNTTILPGEDYQIDDWIFTGTLTAGSWQSSGTRTKIVKGVPSGAYYLGVYTDAEHTISERVEANNTLSASSPLITIPVLPPDAPVLLSPANASLLYENLPYFDWDNGSQVTSWDFRVDNNPDFTTPEMVESVSESNIRLHDPLADGLWYWRVRAQNAGGASLWSETRSFSILTPPDTPAPSFPDNGSETTDQTPMFSWKGVSKASGYRLQVDDQAGFSSPAVNITTASTTYTSVTALSGGTWYWRVQAYDDAGASAWSSVWQFTLYVAPATPVLLLPANNGSITDATPSFSWGSVFQAESYDLQINTSTDFGTSVVDMHIDQNDCTLASELTRGYWVLAGSRQQSGRIERLEQSMEAHLDPAIRHADPAQSLRYAYTDRSHTAF